MKKEKEEIVDPKEDVQDNTNWTRWYIALISVLLIQIILFYLITNSF